MVGAAGVGVDAAGAVAGTTGVVDAAGVVVGTAVASAGFSVPSYFGVMPTSTKGAPLPPYSLGTLSPRYW